MALDMPSAGYPYYSFKDLGLTSLTFLDCLERD